MRSPLVRGLFVTASFVPLVIVVLLAAYLATAFSGVMVPSRADIEHSLIALLVGATCAAFVQIGLGIAVALHTTGRPDLTSGQKMGWTLACIFVGSIALPLFSFIVLPGVKALPPR